MTTLTLSGDMTFHQGFTKDSQVWNEDILSIFKDTLLCTNLEMAITQTSTKWPNKSYYTQASYHKVAPELFNILRPPGPMVANLANNHILDYGLDGFIETLITLQEANIPYTGFGYPTILKYGNLTFGFVGYTDCLPEWKNYINHIDMAEPSAALSEVKHLAKQVDVVVVYLHYGRGRPPTKPSPKYIKFFRALIDAGARIVAGTSPQCVLPVEAYGSGLIFYSLNNLINNYPRHSFRDDLTILAQVTFDSQGYITKAVAYPARIKNLQIRLLPSTDPDYTYVQNALYEKVTTG